MISPFANGGNGGGIGEIKFSNDGLKVAYCINSTLMSNRVRVADFNKTTGVASNAFEITYSAVVNETPYGIEFSPDNSKLYVGLLRQGKLFQYNMAAGTPASIIASELRLDPFTSTTFTQFANMTLGPDGRIWISRDQYYIDYIDQPNLAGTACGYTTDLLNMSSPTWFGWAMPNFVKGLSLLSTPRISGPRRICINTTHTLESRLCPTRRLRLYGPIRAQALSAISPTARYNYRPPLTAASTRYPSLILVTAVPL